MSGRSSFERFNVTPGPNMIMRGAGSEQFVRDDHPLVMGDRVLVPGGLKVIAVGGVAEVCQIDDVTQIRITIGRGPAGHFLTMTTIGARELAKVLYDLADICDANAARMAAAAIERATKAGDE